MSLGRLHLCIAIKTFLSAAWRAKGSEYWNMYNFPFLHSISLLLTFTNHDPRVCIHHYYIVIWLLYNKRIKVNALPISWEAVMLTHLFFFRMGIDSIPQNTCWPISALLRQWNATYTSIDHTNKPLQRTENTVHNQCLPCSTQLFYYPPHQCHGWCPRSSLKIWTYQPLWSILTFDESPLVYYFTLSIAHSRVLPSLRMRLPRGKRPSWTCEIVSSYRNGLILKVHPGGHEQIFHVIIQWNNNL